jgi:hypothetical protein
MNTSSGRVRHTRRPALDQCEDRIVQSTTAASVGGTVAQLLEAASTANGSRTLEVYKPTVEPASRVFDDPFFFDVN